MPYDKMKGATEELHLSYPTAKFESPGSVMEGLTFLPFMFLVVFSVSSTQISKPSTIKLEENQKPSLILETKNEANPAGGEKPDEREGGLTPGKPGMLILQGQPGYSNQPGKPVSGDQQGRPEVLKNPGMPSPWILQGKPGESNQKGTSRSSNKQEESGSRSQQGKPGSPNQKGKPISPKNKDKPKSLSQKVKPTLPTLPTNKGKPGSLESSSQQGKPGSSGQPWKPKPSSQQRKPRSLYNQEERKNEENLSKDGTMRIKAGSMVSKSPAGKERCDSVYKPVCGSDGKTYGNSCVFKEAKRLSRGKLTLNHEGKC
ncbi:MARCO-like protein [Arvicola amphibius]|uniref:MARCO-like protein n=1 Tax=Arvicola amphibius TaxID=1047088 RepID=UPI001C087AAF|nr:MARCO-like protein [Arvicola amphibius]